MNNNRKVLAEKVVSLMDLTALNDNDTKEVITNLCRDANNSVAKTAAVCVYSKFVAIAKEELSSTNCSEIKVATVVNFPAGGTDVKAVLAETKQAISLGADEIDLVLPYKSLIAGNADICFEMINECSKLCQSSSKLLKVIIESGELKTKELIRQASEITIEAGADFIKTSTGKVPVNATTEAAKTILETIKAQSTESKVGFKASGGIRTLDDAIVYIDLASEIMGSNWVNADKFRFGVSGLLVNILKEFGSEELKAKEGDY